MSPARTTDDLPLPLGPTTARKRAHGSVPSRRARSRRVRVSRPWKSTASASVNGRSPLYGFRSSAAAVVAERCGAGLVQVRDEASRILRRGRYESREQGDQIGDIPRLGRAGRSTPIGKSER